MYVVVVDCPMTWYFGVMSNSDAKSYSLSWLSKDLKSRFLQVFHHVSLNKIFRWNCIGRCSQFALVALGVLVLVLVFGLVCFWLWSPTGQHVLQRATLMSICRMLQLFNFSPLSFSFSFAGFRCVASLLFLVEPIPGYSLPVIAATSWTLAPLVLWWVPRTLGGDSAASRLIHGTTSGIPTGNWFCSSTPNRMDLSMFQI